MAYLFTIFLPASIKYKLTQKEGFLHIHSHTNKKTTTSDSVGISQSNKIWVLRIETEM